YCRDSRSGRGSSGELEMVWRSGSHALERGGRAGRRQRRTPRDLHPGARFVPVVGGKVQDHAVFLADAAERGGRRGVGDEVVDLGDVADAPGRGSTVLRAVGDQDRAATALDDLPGDLHLPVVVVEERAILVD